MSVRLVKSFSLLSLLVLFTFLKIHAQVSFGLTLGVNQSSMQFKDPAGHAAENNKPLRRLNADLLINVPLVGGLYVVPGLRYITKGVNLTAGEVQSANFEASKRLEVHYLEIPVYMTYKIPVSFGKLTVGVGPYAAYGLSGNNRLQVYDAGAVVSTTNYDVGFSGKVNKGIYPGTRLNRWDVGANASAGVEFTNLLMVGVYYSRGIRNLDLSGRSIIRNCSAGVSIGIILNREDY